MFNNKDGCNQKYASKVFKVNQSTISRILNKKCNIKYFKKIKAPNYSAKQLPRVISCSRKLATKTLVNKIVILDDEKYFSLSNSNTPGNDGYYTNNKSTAPEDIKYAKKNKFEKKVLVWLAISTEGISEPYIHESNNAITANVYINKCLKNNLIKFISEHHFNKEYIFWPDLAKAHYAKETLDWFKSKNINLVPKEENPPNLPQSRPIENLWSILSSKVYEHGWKANSIKQLKTRIKKKIKEISINELQSLLGSIRTKLRKIADNGPYSVI